VDDALITVRNLHYTYEDGTRALAGVDFILREGETVALLGANGSGKTTFVLHLNGLLLAGDSVSVCGLSMNRRTLPEIRRLVGLVFQDSDEQLFMPTVLDDVAFGPLNLGMLAAEADIVARNALTSVGMAEHARKAPYHLSAGEKRRVAIAGVLAMSPRILVLDEPTTFLDPPGERELLTLLRSIPQAKIIVTHDIMFARAIATRAVFFEKGKILAEGTVDEIVERFNWQPG
jgi:cobalt/nickel transport system ATP-binding protein